MSDRLFMQPGNLAGLHFSSTTLEYALSGMQTVDLQLLDLSGREMWHSHLGSVPGGIHQQAVPTANLSAGIYLLRLRTGEQSSHVKLIKQ